MALRVKQIRLLLDCATSTKNIDEEGAGKCVFATDKKVVKTHFF